VVDAVCVFMGSSMDGV